jgi:hypothetical protein
MNYPNEILLLIYKLQNFKDIRISNQVEVNITSKHNDFLIQKVLGAGLSWVVNCLISSLNRAIKQILHTQNSVFKNLLSVEATTSTHHFFVHCSLQITYINQSTEITESRAFVTWATSLT